MRAVGHVVALRVTRSSGSSELDLAACGRSTIHARRALALDHARRSSNTTLPSTLALHLRLLDDAAGRAADVERAQRELRARLADRLRRDDADRLADVDQRPVARLRP